MSDNESDSTHISYSSIVNEINKLVDSKIKLDEMFKDFTDSSNSLNSYIGLYERHNVLPQLGKKKFCSNVNNNDDNNQCNNNNNRPKKHRTCCYTETDPEGKAEYKKGETELERHRRLLAYQIKRVAKLEEKQQRAANKLVNTLSLSVDNNNILDVNNNILFTRDNNSDTSTDSSNKNITPNHSTSTPQINVHIPKSANNKDKKKEIRISKEKIDSSNISSTTPKPSVPTTLNDEVKIKRKRDQIKPSTNSSIIYTVESENNNKLSTSDSENNNKLNSVPTPSVHNSDDHKLDYDLASESDSDDDDHVHDTELNQQSTTTTDVGAFPSETTVSNGNNN
jgi:hypothetical protein